MEQFIPPTEELEKKEVFIPPTVEKTEEEEKPPVAGPSQALDLAMTLGAAEDRDHIEVYNNIKDNAEVPAVAYNTELEDKQDEADIKILREETADLPNEAKTAVIMDWYNARRVERSKPGATVKKAMVNEAVNFATKAKTPAQKSFAQAAFDYLSNDKGVIWDDKLSADYWNNVAEIQSRIGANTSTLADLGGLVIPFAENLGISRIDTEVFGDKHNSIRSTLFTPGDYVKLWQEEIMSRIGEERYKLGTKLIKAIRDKSGIFGGGNELAALGYLEAIFKNYVGNKEAWGLESSMALTNLGAIADVASVGLSAAKGFGTIYRAGQATHLATIARTNPIRYSQMQAQVLAAANNGSPDAVIRSIIADHMPKIPVGPGQGVSVNSQRIFEQAVDIVHSALKNEWAYEAEQVDSIRDVVRNAFQNIKGASLRLNQSFTSPVITKQGEAGFLSTAMFGADDFVPFADYGSALNKGKELFGNDAKINVYAYDAGSGRLIRASGAAHGVNVSPVQFKKPYRTPIRHPKGYMQAGNLGYFFEVEDMFTPIHHNYMEAQKMFLGPNTVAMTSHFAATNVVDVNSALGQQAAARMGRFVDKVKGTEKQLNDLLKGTFLKLGKREAQRVLDIVQDGRHQEKVFSLDELADMGVVDERLTDSYYAIVTKSNTEYALSDLRFTNYLKSNNMVEVTHAGEGGVYGKALTREKALERTSTFYDPTLRKVVKLTDAELDDLYSRGGRIVETKSKLIDETAPLTKSTHIIVDTAKNTAITAIKQFGNLNYIPGYGYTQLYDNAYYVVRKTNNAVVNGATKTEEFETLFAVNNRLDAQRLMDELSTSVQAGEEYILRDAREFAVQHADLAENVAFDILNTGRPYLGKRGPGLLADIEGNAARTLNPVEAMMKSSFQVSKMQMSNVFIDGIKKQFVNSFDEVIGRDKATGMKLFPSSADEIVGDVRNRGMVNQAKILWNYVNMVSSARESWFFNKWSRTLASVAEWIEMGGWAQTGHQLRKLGKSDPYASMRKLPFAMWIIGNPIRQFLLQTSQAALIAGANPKYAFTRLIPDTMTLAAAVGSKGGSMDAMYQASKAGMAKVMGMQVDEFDKFVQAVKDSGLLSTIDSNLFFSSHGQAATMKTHLGRSGVMGAAQGATDLFVNTPINMAKALGFDWGEANMIFASTMMALKDFQKSNPQAVWTKARNLDAIFGKARQYALSMNSAGAMKYQHGVLSLMTQFMSYQHKALLTMLPAVAGGSKAFTGSQKAGMLVTNTLLFGLTGLGMRELYTKARDYFGIEVDPALDKFAIGGMIDYVVEKLFELSGDDDTDLDITGTFAPGAGILGSWGNFIFGLFEQDTGLLEKLGGATYDSAVKFKDTVALTNMIIKTGGNDLETTKAALQSMTTLLSGYDNFTKYRVMRNLGYAVNKSGDPIAKATYAEALAKIAGINSKEVVQYASMQMALYGEGKQGELFKGSSPKDVARVYVNNMKQILMKYAEEPVQNFDEMYKRLLTDVKLRNFVISSHDAGDVMPIMKEINNILKDRKQEASVEIVNSIIKIMSKGGTDNISYVVNKAKHTNLFTPDQLNNLQWFLERAESEKSDMEQYLKDKVNE